MVIIITYDLRTPKDYHDFYEAIKSQADSGKWWHYMTSTWLLSTTRSPQQVADAVQPYLDAQDFLFVCELTSNYQGRLPKPAWDWIQSELAPNYLTALLGSAPTAPILPGFQSPPNLYTPPTNPFFEPGKTMKLEDLITKLPPPPKKPGER
jgi:hypothetical protein